jgi:AcrR family transcriptional regulator
MPGNKMGQQTKEKILEAAKLEFLEKGFGPAKVDDIARRAGITKAMLYYHFNTKENIFNEIVNKVVAEVRQEFRSTMSLADMGNPEQFRNHLKAMATFYYQRQNIIRLVIAEQFSDRNQKNVSQLTVFKDIFELIKELAGKNPERDEDEFLIRLFFFNALPMLLYASLSDQFCSDFGISPEKCLDVFTDTFTRSFLSSAASTR